MSFWKFSIVFAYLVVSCDRVDQAYDKNPLKAGKNQCGIWDLFHPKAKDSVLFTCYLKKKHISVHSESPSFQTVSRASQNNIVLSMGIDIKWHSHSFTF